MGNNVSFCGATQQEYNNFIKNHLEHEYLKYHAKKILERSVILAGSALYEYDENNKYKFTNAEEGPKNGNWEKFDEEDEGFTKNGKIAIINNSFDKTLWINTSSIIIKKDDIKYNTKYNITGQIKAKIVVSIDNKIEIDVTKANFKKEDLMYSKCDILDTTIDNQNPKKSQKKSNSPKINIFNTIKDKFIKQGYTMKVKSNPNTNVHTISSMGCCTDDTDSNNDYSECITYVSINYRERGDYEYDVLS